VHVSVELFPVQPPQPIPHEQADGAHFALIEELIGVAAILVAAGPERVAETATHAHHEVHVVAHGYLDIAEGSVLLIPGDVRGGVDGGGDPHEVAQAEVRQGLDVRLAVGAPAHEQGCLPIAGVGHEQGEQRE
jgi:hypothetical protein